jgi:serine/threonine-protein kinase
MVVIPTLQSPSSRGPQSSAPELSPGDVLGEKYVLLRSLGLGGMGQVWLATNTATGAEVAAKVMHPARAAAPEAIARFRREAEATAALSHRGIVKVFDLVELSPDHGSMVLVMEVLRGRTLGEVLEEQRRLTVAETLRIVVPILSALAHAHERGVVHRDLKPDNVFLAIEPDGELLPKLLDFGVSKSRHGARTITIDGEVVGTPSYMSPEQAWGAPVDERSDVFAAGILLYECLAGVNPFAAEGIQLMAQAVRDRTPPQPAGVPRALWRVIARAIEKDPAQRYRSALELACALHAAAPTQDDLPTWALAPTLAGAPPRPRSRGRALGVALAMAAMALVASGAASSWASRPARSGEARAARTAGSKQMVPDLDSLAAPAPATTSPPAPPRVAARHRGWPAVAPMASAARRPSVVFRDPGF